MAKTIQRKHVYLRVFSKSRGIEIHVISRQTAKYVEGESSSGIETYTHTLQFKSNISRLVDRFSFHSCG